MHRYGVKIKSGKVLWVMADDVEVSDGMILFVKTSDSRREVLAGFALAAIDHFGRPEAFAAGNETAD